MKNRYFIILASLVSTYLFYNQDGGINYVVFSIVYSLLLTLTFNETKRTKVFYASSILWIVAAITVFLYGYTTSYLIYALLFFTCNASRLNSQSVVFNSVNSFVNVVASPYNIFSQNKNEQTKIKPLLIKLAPFAIALSVAFLFYQLYRSSNPLLDWLTNQIDLGFISFGGIAFLIVAAFVISGIVINNKYGVLEYGRVAKNISVSTTANSLESSIAIYTFITISVLLFLVNLIDIITLSSGILPEDLSYSEYVHQGFWTLVFTLALSVAIVLFFFKGALNFDVTHSKLFTLCTTWLMLNAILVLTTIWKNLLYVHEYSLTYKRIMVFVALLLAFTYLIITYQKVIHKHTLLHFFNKVIIATVIMGVLISSLPLTHIITNYNLESNPEEVDIDYLLSLKNNTINLYNQLHEHPEVFSFSQKSELRQQLQSLQSETSSKDWQAFNIENLRSTEITLINIPVAKEQFYTPENFQHQNP